MQHFRLILVKLAVSLCTIFCLLGVMTPAAQAADSVTVTLPDFPITLNGTVIDNTHRTYPLLVYRGITYFPLTYHDTRYLGVESRWDQAAQTLTVDKSNISGGYQAEQQKQANGKSATASICPYKVVINGTAVDNSKETYPLLIFRNVTYFPMTWAYGVDQFDWQYDFDNKTGLTIASAHQQPQELNLNLGKSAAFTSVQGDYSYIARLVGDYVYYQGANGAIYQAPVKNPQQAKAIFQLPKSDYDPAAYVSAALGELDGQMALYYHQGGSLMGENVAWIFDTNGSKQSVNDDRSTHTVQGDGFTLSTSSGMYNTGELYKTVSGQEPVVIGGQSVHYFGTPVISGQKAYLIGSEFDQAINADRHGLYAVDLTTNQTRLINDPALRLDVLSADRLSEGPDHMLYFVGGTMTNGLWTARDLYQLDLRTANPGTAEVKLVAKLNATSPYYAFAGDTLYYGAGAGDSQALYRLGQTNPINPNGHLIYLYPDQGYVIAGFEETAAADTRLLIFDQNGQEVFRSADVAQRPQIDHNRLFYITKDGRSYLVPLK